MINCDFATFQPIRKWVTALHTTFYPSKALFFCTSRPTYKLSGLLQDQQKWNDLDLVLVTVKARIKGDVSGVLLRRRSWIPIHKNTFNTIGVVECW